MLRSSSRAILLTGALLFFCGMAFTQSPGLIPNSVPVHLRVEAGTPLRLYITHRVWYRDNETVDAKFAEPVWAFDRIVIPAGTMVQGRVAVLAPVPGMERAQAIAGGDFTPLKRAQIGFTSLTFPDGRTMQIETQSSLGLSTIYVPGRATKAATARKSTPSKVNRAKQFLRQQAESQLNAKSRGLFDFIRGPNKREWVENFLLSKLPYHPQWYRAGTRFDAVLQRPLEFNDVIIPPGNLADVGTQPAPDAVAEMRILSDLSSADAHIGDAMEGMLSKPLFSAAHKLVLPQGTRLSGKITLARRARFLHRGGQLRFAIQNVQVPNALALANGEPVFANARTEPTEAQLAAVEADPGAVKVDPEGTAKATESKTRLFRPAIAALVATKSMDNDAGKQTASGTGSANPGGRTLGGFSGFGLLGVAASRGPHQIGTALGFYGLAWSVYSNVISRGREVTFQKNTAMMVRFGAPPRKR